jgi:Bifunctional DNA primase/polymerase, N-terminal/AAA domain
MHGPQPSSGQSAPHADASKLTWARYYANRGCPVLPLYSVEGGRCTCGDVNCRSPGKHPRTQHGVKDASAHSWHINRWWRGWPSSNVGIATGVVSGLVVFDIDPRNGGDASYDQLRKQYPAAFEDLLEVQTGSGGKHLYFECRSPARSRANILPGIDVKADGGHVVAPPSQHVSGVPYRFASNGILLLPSLPQPLWDLISAEPQAHAAAQDEYKNRIEIESLRVSNEIKTLIHDGKPEGQRSEAIFAAIRALIKAGHSDQEIAAVLVDPANRLSEKPRVKGAAWLSGEIKRARAKPDRENDLQTPLGTDRVLICRRASEIKLEAIYWVWPSRIARGKISLIAGEPGLGKSQLGASLTATVSSGSIWSTGEKCEAGDVLLLSAEDDPADTIRPRLEACCANLDRVHIIEAVRHKRRDQPFNLKHDLEALAAKLAASPEVKLIVIDPISAYLGDTDSHNNSQVRGVLAPLAKLAADHRVAVPCGCTPSLLHLGSRGRFERFQINVTCNFGMAVD